MCGFCHIVRQINVTMVLLHLKERRDGLKEIHQHMLPSDTLFWIKDYWTIFHTILISGKCLFYLYNTFCCITSINLPILFYLLHSHYRSTAELETFQNLILMYASKRHSYTPPVYQCRNLLAALDHNCHTDRSVITNKDGSGR